MARALAPEGEFRGERLVEDHHRLGRQRPVLGGAEGEDVDPGAPGDLGRAHLQEGERIGEARAVHMQLHAIALAGRRDRRHLGRAIAGAGFRRLGQADGRRLDVMDHALMGGGQCGLDLGRAHLAVVAHQVHQLGAAGIELRRAAFIDADMSVALAIDGPEGRRHHRQGKRIGAGPGRHRKCCEVGLEDLLQLRLDAGRQRVLAIGGDRAGIGPGQRREDFGRGAGDIVAAEIHGPWIPMAKVGREARCGRSPGRCRDRPGG